MTPYIRYYERGIGTPKIFFKTQKPQRINQSFPFFPKFGIDQIRMMVYTDGMKILIACEESQRVTKAFRDKGHEAYSCDILDTSGDHPEWHLKQDVIPLLDERNVARSKTFPGVAQAMADQWGVWYT